MNVHGFVCNCLAVTMTCTVLPCTMPIWALVLRWSCFRPCYYLSLGLPWSGLLISLALPRLSWLYHVCLGTVTSALALPRLPWPCHVCLGPATSALAVVYSPAVPCLLQPKVTVVRSLSYSDTCHILYISIPRAAIPEGKLWGNNIFLPISLFRIHFRRVYSSVRTVCAPAHNAYAESHCVHWDTVGTPRKQLHITPQCGYCVQCERSYTMLHFAAKCTLLRTVYTS